MHSLKKFLPTAAKLALRRLFSKPAPYNAALGEFILEMAREFSRARGGIPEALEEPTLRASITRNTCVSHLSEAQQHLQTVFMPHYETNLFEYYRQQQYMLLLNYMGYPFLGLDHMRMAVDPIVCAASKLDKIRALDYGAGLPYGLFHLLRTAPEKFESITIVDLDLIHAEFCEFILKQFGVSVTYHKLTDCSAIADLSAQSFNLIYAKDILEHVHNPERLLRALLVRAEKTCVAYCDIRDHGSKRLQHVSPNLAPLVAVMKDCGFQDKGTVSKMPQFVRE